MSLSFVAARFRVVVIVVVAHSIVVLNFLLWMHRYSSFATYSFSHKYWPRPDFNSLRCHCGELSLSAFEWYVSRDYITYYIDALIALKQNKNMKMQHQIDVYAMAAKHQRSNGQQKIETFAFGRSVDRLACWTGKRGRQWIVSNYIISSSRVFSAQTHSKAKQMFK